MSWLSKWIDGQIDASIVRVSRNMDDKEVVRLLPLARRVVKLLEESKKQPYDGIRKSEIDPC